MTKFISIAALLVAASASGALANDTRHQNCSLLESRTDMSRHQLIAIQHFCGDSYEDQVAAAPAAPAPRAEEPVAARDEGDGDNDGELPSLSTAFRD